jgi:MYXO-CTERM domain-containing protein
MARLVRSFLALEAVAFLAAALVHSGVLVRGHEHAKAATAEVVIGLVVTTALVATMLAPAASRAIGMSAQAFALVATLVGLFTIAIGVGPRTAPDLVFHAAVLALLGVGLAWSWRRPADAPRSALP